MIKRAIIAACLAVAVTPVAAQDVPQNAIDAIRFADQGDYTQALELAQHPATVDLVQWFWLRSGRGRWSDYRAFLNERPDWPGLATVRARAEEVIPEGADGSAVIDWFADDAPRTGEGAVRLAEALLQAGQTETAHDVIRTAWRDLRLSNSGQSAMIAAFPDLLEDVHVDRVHNLLWRWRVTEARRMLDVLDDDTRALVQARIAYIRESGITAAVEAVPDALKDHPGLAYDRYNWLASEGRRGEAIAILRARSTNAQALGEPFRWSGWRRSLARSEMRQGRADVAYELAANHFLTDGSAFADLEWLAGFIQLTDLDDPEAALAHFDAARAAVESPISVSRMAYWQGRAYEVLGDAAAAEAAYGGAAQHQTAYYGLLAAEKLGLNLDAALVDADGTWDIAAFDNDLVRAAFTLLEAGERGHATTFFVAIGRSLPPETIRQVAAALTDADEVYFAVAMGKAAVTQGKVVPSAYFPLHPLKDEAMQVAPALALSIARRESEFNAGVGSPVGALGLMQLMPPTAEEVAGFEGIRYSRSRLTEDWAYNARLGVRYLAELEARFGPSPVQVAAGYNAGPSRPEIWMDERGDPRTGGVDVVDWIEHIPFRETRNYVMRVTESLPVYQARLSGNTGPVRFSRLLQGEKLLIRPVARGNAQRPVESALAPRTSTSNAPPLRAVARPSGPTGPQGIRPIARPGG